MQKEIKNVFKFLEDFKAIMASAKISMCNWCKNEHSKPWDSKCTVILVFDIEDNTQEEELDRRTEEHNKGENKLVPENIATPESANQDWWIIQYPALHH